MSNSTQTRHRLNGAINWNSNGFEDIYYLEPNPDTNSASNKSSIKRPSHASKCLSISYVKNSTIQFSEIITLICICVQLKQASIQTSHISQGGFIWIPGSDQYQGNVETFRRFSSSSESFCTIMTFEVTWSSALISKGLNFCATEQTVFFCKNENGCEILTYIRTS